MFRKAEEPLVYGNYITLKVMMLINKSKSIFKSCNKVTLENIHLFYQE